MTKRKNNYYQASDDFGTETHENYREAFADYNRKESPATLYGAGGNYRRSVEL